MAPARLSQRLGFHFKSGDLKLALKTLPAVAQPAPVAGSRLAVIYDQPYRVGAIDQRAGIDFVSRQQLARDHIVVLQRFLTVFSEKL